MIKNEGRMPETSKIQTCSLIEAGTKIELGPKLDPVSESLALEAGKVSVVPIMARINESNRFLWVYTISLFHSKFSGTDFYFGQLFNGVDWKPRNADN